MQLISLTQTSPQKKSIVLREKTVDYTAQFETAEFSGSAQITAFTYLIENGDPKRPVLFVTNGGPGSGVVWLHLGLFGPRRIHLEDPIRPQTVPPYRLEDNPHCPLDICDIVLMDPPGAGFSHEPDESTAAEFYSTDGDAHAFALFIEEWMIRHGRANAPIYFAGESYGTVRAPALADALMGGPFSSQQRQVSISLSGILFLGTAFTTEPGVVGKPPAEESVRNLLCCAATAAYHHPESGVSPREAAEKAWDFAPEYLTALFLGNALPEKKQDETAQTLSSLLHIPAPVLKAGKLRYTLDQFRRSVLPGKEAGAYDGRYLMNGVGKPGNFPMPGMIDPVAEDPAMGMYTPAFIGGMNLLRGEMELPENVYTAISFSVNGRWNYQSNRAPLASLENAMRRNGSMRLFFGTGLFDLVTVPGNVRYTLNQSSLPMERVTAIEYESGHMAYLGEESAEQLDRDIHEFIR